MNQKLFSGNLSAVFFVQSMSAVLCGQSFVEHIDCFTASFQAKYGNATPYCLQSLTLLSKFVLFICIMQQLSLSIFYLNEF